MSDLSTGLLTTIALVALAATLGASELLVRGVGRLARNLALLGGIVGLIIALGADSPEISSAIAASAAGSAAVGIGVVIGSNIFNIAVLLGAGTLAAGELRIKKPAVLLDAGVAIVVTVALGATLLGELSLAMGWVVLGLVFAPYVALLALGPVAVDGLPAPSLVRAFLDAALREAALEGKDLEAQHSSPATEEPARSWRPVLLVAPAVAVIVLGSVMLVQSAQSLGDRWGVPSTLVGLVGLAAATSLPNAYAATRLALSGHGAAVVSATYNSNTLNLVAGFAVPALFVSFHSAVPRAYIAWLLGMSVLALILLLVGLDRRGAVILLAGYASFVAYAVVTA